MTEWLFTYCDCTFEFQKQVYSMHKDYAYNSNGNCTVIENTQVIPLQQQNLDFIWALISMLMYFTMKINRIANNTVPHRWKETISLWFSLDNLFHSKGVGLQNFIYFSVFCNIIINLYSHRTLIRSDEQRLKKLNSMVLRSPYWGEEGESTQFTLNMKYFL